MRTIVDLSDEQIEDLRRYCEGEGVSRAEAVRRGVDLLLKEKTDRKARLLAALKAAAGSWDGDPKDGLEYQLRIRSEWDRDET
jgi:Arc/MetJ-type ribon-helix-helix transcriptional regulator